MVQIDLHLDIDIPPGKPVRARVEAALREAIRSGRLPPGTRLPSTRELSGQLGVSRGVLTEVYAQLAAEGHLRARRGAGTIVASMPAPAGAAHRSVTAQRQLRYDLSPFRPSLGSFPRGAWVTALTRAARSAGADRLGYPDLAGVPELRTALAAYLGRSRGVQAEPDRLVIASSLRQGLSLLWSVLAARGVETVAIERPGWRGMRETAVDAGLATAGVPVDEQGLVAGELDGLQAQAIAVAPAHQFPTGAVMSAARRGELVRWCRRHDAIVVEDDYDAEYRYDRRPVGALQGLAPEAIVYGGSASKSLAPAIRLGWLALPEALVEPVARLQGLRGGMPSPLQQLAFAELIERGELDRHLRRQRRIYRARRDALLEELAARLPEVRVTGAAAGLFVVLLLPADVDEQATIDAARAAGIEPHGLGGAEPCLVVGYANLGQASVAPAVGLLAESIAAGRRSNLVAEPRPAQIAGPRPAGVAYPEPGHVARPRPSDVAGPRPGRAAGRASARPARGSSTQVAGRAPTRQNVAP